MPGSAQSGCSKLSHTQSRHKIAWRSAGDRVQTEPSPTLPPSPILSRTTSTTTSFGPFSSLSYTVDSHKPDTLSDFRRVVDALGSDLRTVNGKLDEIMSLLGTGRIQCQAHQGSGPYLHKLLLQPQNDSTRVPGGGGAGSVSSFGGDAGRGDRGTQASLVEAAPPLTAVCDGAGGFGLLGVTGGQGPFLDGAPIGKMAPRLVLNQQQRQQQTRPSKPESCFHRAKPGGAPPGDRMNTYECFSTLCEA